MESKLVFIVLLAMLATACSNFCCYPKEFEIGEGAMIGYNSDDNDDDDDDGLINMFSYTAMDANKKITGSFVYVEASEIGKSCHFRIVMDYDKQEQHIIEDEGKKCKTHELKEPYPGCVPDGVHPEGPLYLGDHKLELESYYYAVHDQKKKIRGGGSGSVTKESCIPNSYTFAGEIEEDKVLISGGFFNYTSPISNPDKYFNIPASCKNSTDIGGPKEPKKGKVAKLHKLLKAKLFW